MNTFRNEPRRRRQSIDGISNVPSRTSVPNRAFGGQRSSRTAINLNRAAKITPERFAAQNPHHHNRPSPLKATPSMYPRPVRTQSEDVSLLHMSLPPGMSLANTARNRQVKTHSGRDLKSKLLRKLPLKIAGTVTVLFLLVGGFLFVKGYMQLHKVFKGGGAAVALTSHVNPSLLKGEGDGRVNILLLGIGGDGHDGADLTDTMLLASIDPVNNKASLLSIPRDLWVANGKSSSKINAVFAFAKEKAANGGADIKTADAAGAKAAEQVVTTITGVPIHYYGLVDFQAFQQAVDTVGGVDMNVTADTAVSEHLWNETTRKNYFLDVVPGQQHFDGQRALFYARSRHTSPRGDFDRSERQRLLIEALTQKIASASTFTNPVKVSQLMDAFGNHVATDISLDDAMRLMRIGKAIGGGFDSVDLAPASNPLVKTGTAGNQSVVLPTAGIGNYSAIQALVRVNMPDGYIIKEHASINILNGTPSSGLATQKAEELRSYGYNVATVTDAPTQGYSDAVIIDLSKGQDPYTKNYLEKRFGVKATTKLPDANIHPGAANFVIILGQHETTNS